MEKLLHLCAAMFSLGLFTACDPGYYIDYSISNKSGHDVTIRSSFPPDNTLWNNNPDGIALSNGQDTLSCTTEGLGTANLVQTESDINGATGAMPSSCRRRSLRSRPQA